MKSLFVLLLVTLAFGRSNVLDKLLDALEEELAAAPQECTNPRMPCTAAKKCCAFGNEEYECVEVTKVTPFGKTTGDRCTPKKCVNPRMPCKKGSLTGCCPLNGEEYECVTHTQAGPFGTKTSDRCMAKPTPPTKPAPVRQCKPCDCRSWDGKNYSNCVARPRSQCRGYCVQCESDGVTPMPGGWTKHAAECKKYEASPYCAKFAGHSSLAAKCENGGYFAKRCADVCAAEFEVAEEAQGTEEECMAPLSNYFWAKYRENKEKSEYKADYKAELAALGVGSCKNVYKSKCGQRLKSCISRKNCKARNTDRHSDQYMECIEWEMSNTRAFCGNTCETSVSDRLNLECVKAGKSVMGGYKCCPGLKKKAKSFYHICEAPAKPQPNLPDCTCAEDKYPQNSENEKSFCQFGANCAPGSKFPNGCPGKRSVQCARPKTKCKQPNMPCTANDKCCNLGKEEYECVEHKKFNPFTGTQISQRCLAKPTPARVCKPCDCQHWDGKNYSRCVARPKSQCRRFCVQCENDGVTPMPGFWSKHAAECRNYAASEEEEEELAELEEELAARFLE